jgi:phosphate transport system protein
MTPAREHFVQELETLEAEAMQMLDLVVAEIGRTMRALESRDASLAAAVVQADDEIDARYHELHGRTLSLIARQAPVATDLRLASALLDVVRHAERMGDYCVNVAKFVPPRDCELPPTLLEHVLAMGSLAAELVIGAKDAFGRRDAEAAEALARHDDELDRLNRESFELAFDAVADPAARAAALQLMLIARWIERLGDHAVDIGEEAAFVATGEFREFSDASHPSVAGDDR